MIVFDGFKIFGLVFTGVFIALVGVLYLALVLADKYNEWRK